MSREDVKTILERPTCSVDEFAELMWISRNPAYEAVKRGDVHILVKGKSEPESNRRSHAHIRVPSAAGFAGRVFRLQ